MKAQLSVAVPVFRFLFKNSDRGAQSHPNPLQLSLIESAFYLRNRLRQTHCDYLACFQQLRLEKGLVFSKRMAKRAAARLQPDCGSAVRVEKGLPRKLESHLFSMRCLEKPGAAAAPDAQSQPNPLDLSLTESECYLRNGSRQSHCAYLTCFQQLRLEKRPVFGKRMASRDASSWANKAGARPSRTVPGTQSREASQGPRSPDSRPRIPSPGTPFL